MAEKPILSQCLDAMSEVLRALQTASENYQRAKSYLGANLNSVAAEKLPQLMLTLPGTTVVVPLDLRLLPGEQLQMALELACTTYGEEILRLWAEAREIATRADNHCQTARAAAAAETETQS